MDFMPEVGSKVIFNKGLDAEGFWPAIPPGDHVVVVASHLSPEEDVVLFYQDVWGGNCSVCDHTIITGTAMSYMFKPVGN